MKPDRPTGRKIYQRVKNSAAVSQQFNIQGPTVFNGAPQPAAEAGWALVAAVLALIFAAVVLDAATNVALLGTVLLALGVAVLSVSLRRALSSGGTPLAYPVAGLITGIAGFLLCLLPPSKAYDDATTGLSRQHLARTDSKDRGTDSNSNTQSANRKTSTVHNPETPPISLLDASTQFGPLLFFTDGGVPSTQGERAWPMLCRPERHLCYEWPPDRTTLEEGEVAVVDRTGVGDVDLGDVKFQGTYFDDQLQCHSMGGACDGGACRALVIPLIFLNSGSGPLGATTYVHGDGVIGDNLMLIEGSNEFVGDWGEWSGLGRLHLLVPGNGGTKAFAVACMSRHTDPPFDLTVSYSLAAKHPSPEGRMKWVGGLFARRSGPGVHEMSIRIGGPTP